MALASQLRAAPRQDASAGSARRVLRVGAIENAGEVDAARPFAAMRVAAVDVAARVRVGEGERGDAHRERAGARRAPTRARRRASRARGAARGTRPAARARDLREAKRKLALVLGRVQRCPRGREKPGSPSRARSARSVKRARAANPRRRVERPAPLQVRIRQAAVRRELVEHAARSAAAAAASSTSWPIASRSTRLAPSVPPACGRQTIWKSVFGISGPRSMTSARPRAGEFDAVGQRAPEHPPLHARRARAACSSSAEARAHVGEREVRGGASHLALVHASPRRAARPGPARTLTG